LRDEGLTFVGRANRWMISGAVLLAAGVSAVTAHAFHAHTAGGAQQSKSSSQASASSQQSGDDGSGAPLQSPSQAPSTAPAAPAPVVSGGS
jgi:hypothetical protein